MVDKYNFEKGLAVLFFQTKECAACSVLYEKILNICNSFKNVRMISISETENRDIYSRYNVYSAPLVLGLADGKEIFRKGAFTHPEEVRDILTRYSEMMT